MAVTINWGTKVISVPQSFLTALGGTSYELDTNAFRIALRDLEDDEAGQPFPITHNHNTTVLLGGILYARIIEIINGYTITFEETGSPYSVRLVGSNNNIVDVTNLGTVQILSNNSAGLVDGSAGIAAAVWQDANATALIAKMQVVEAILRNKTVTDPVTGVMTVYDTDGTTPLLTAQMYEGTGTSQKYRGQGAERREKLQ